MPVARRSFWFRCSWGRAVTFAMIFPRWFRKQPRGIRNCRFRLADAAGEDDAVLDALAAYCVRQSTAPD